MHARVLGLALLGLLAFAPPSASALPAGWAYELVSPLDTNGRDLVTAAGSPDGTHAWFNALVPLSSGQPSGNITSFEATRTSAGWQSDSLADPTAPGNLTALLVARSSDSRAEIVRVCAGLGAGCLGRVSFDRVDANGRTRMLTTSAPDDQPSAIPVMVGGSDDLERILVRVKAGDPPLLREDPPSAGRRLYVSDLGHVENVAIDENGNPLPCGAVLANDIAGNGAGFEQNGLSADARTIFFESPDPEVGCAHAVDLYVRRDGQTVNISAPSSGRDLGSRYAGNSRDGRTVFFTTANRLVPEDTDSTPDIYAYDVETHVVTAITVGANVFTAGASPTVAVSPNGDYVYFVALNPIAGGSLGDQNLYVYHAGAITHITTPANGFFFINDPMFDAMPSPMTPDGTHMLFYSQAALTGQSTGGAPQLFQYSFATNAIACITCRPDGTAPSTGASYGSIALEGNVDQRLQSDDGSSVGFETHDSLLPQDTNGDVIDVYLWHEGQLSLISSGHSPSDSAFHGISADGHTVFFTTTDRLLPWVDQDNNKLYAARLGGGFPHDVPPPCLGAAGCRAAFGPAPAPPKPGSLTAIAPHGGRKASVQLVLGHIGVKARARLVRTGVLTLAVRSSKAGTIRARLAARLNGRWIAAGAASRTLHHAGLLHISVRLSHRARAALAARHTLRLRVTVSEHGARARRVTLTLRSSG